MKSYFSLGITLLLACVAVFGYGFLVFAINSSLQEISISKEDVASISARSVFAKNMEVFLQETTTTREELKSFIAKDNDVVSSIELLERAAKREAVEISIATVAVSSQDWKFHEVVNVTFSVEGSFAALTSFASALETLPQVSRITSTTLEAPEEGKEWFGAFTVQFLKTKDVVQP